jgi:hypothetical protein
MAVEQSPYRMPPPLGHLPQVPPNTVVVMPKLSPMNRGALWALFWTVGLLMGLFARAILDGATDGGLASNTAGANTTGSNQAAMAEAPTMEVHLRAVLELPTATVTSTPRPTATPSPDPASGTDFCATEEAGTLCRVPFPPPPTPTPYPSCADMDRLAPGDWCVWPTAGPMGMSH